MTDRYEILTRTGPGTPMGELMRQYWIPAALSSELKPDGSPVRLMLLGEKLIAFRDSAGRVGVMDHRCPHRCASLFFGRNEEDGIRCIYHGWKFDVDGNCLDMPNVPPQQQFKDKVRAKAYRAAERNGLIWVYMGERGRAPPPLPPLEACLLPEADTEYRFVQRKCNWLQAIDGDLDTSHLGFLHFGSARPSKELDTSRRDLVQNRAPEYKVAETPFGLTYAAHRPTDGGTYWRLAQLLFPFWVMPPIGKIEANVMVRAFVPLDDAHCMFVGIAHKDYMRGHGRQPLPGASLIDRVHPNTTDWLGRFRMVEAEENDYFIDRDVQREKSFTGIEGIHVQDQAVTESMGPIVDRSLENLAPSDIAVVRGRRVLLQAAEAMDRGARPPCADDASAYAGVRGGYFTSADSGDWVTLYRRMIAASQGTAAAAE